MNYNIQRIFAGIALLLAFPIMTLIFIIIFVINGTPVFYRHLRLGKNRKPFMCIKFRTMKRENLIPILNEQQSMELEVYGKIRNDFRITKFGRILRRLSLDEVPQLWNVVKGEMALIGPRPIISEEDQIYGKYSKKLHSVLPGITGLWQVSGRCLTTYHRRIAINMYYIRHRTLILDLWILWKTLWVIVSGKGAF